MSFQKITKNILKNFYLINNININKIKCNIQILTKHILTILPWTIIVHIVIVVLI